MLKTKTYWKIHSILGLVTGIPLLLIALTGSILVFKDEINFLLLPENTISTPTPEGRLPLSVLHDKLEASLPEHVIAGWVIYDPPTQADYVYVIPKGTEEWNHVYVDQYSGETLGAPLNDRAEFMDWVLEIHYSLLSGVIGGSVVGIIALMMIALGLSGFFLYKGFWKSLFKMKWKTSLRQLSGNLHKRVGIISAPIIFILGVTGGWWNISHIIHELTEHHEHHATDRHYMAESIDLDALLAETQKAIPDYSVHYIGFPIEEEQPVSFYGNVDTDHFLSSSYGSIATFDANSGEVLSATHIGESPIFLQLLDTFRPLHFGNFAGIWSRLIWCILGASPGLLALSGFYIYWSRTKKKRSRKKHNAKDDHHIPRSHHFSLR